MAALRKIPRHPPRLSRPAQRADRLPPAPRDHRNISLRSIAGCLRFLTLI